MASLSTKVKLYCEANSKTANFGEGGNVTLQNDSDGKGDYIASWSVDGLTKPTDSQLASYDTAGDIGDQLDEIYKDIDAWKTRIKAVKDANPKE